MQGSKKCRVCGETKPLSEFHRLTKSLDGHQPRCKVCACRVTREWAAANREHTRAYDREYREKNGEALREKARAYAAEHAEEAAAKSRAWYAANRERALARHRAYYQERAGEIKAKARAWRDANPDRKRANDKRFRAENNERVREYQRRYRARKEGVEIGTVDRARAFERDHGLCGICGQPVDPANWHLDHVIPLSQGGPHTQENVQVSHPRCNRAKGGRLSTGSYGR